MNMAKSNPQVTDDKRYGIPACTFYAYSSFGNRGPFTGCKTITANTCCGVYVNQFKVFVDQMKIDVALVSSNDVDMPAAADMDLTTDKLEKLALEVHYLSVY